MALKIIESALNFNYPDEYTTEDFLIDNLLRELCNDQPRSAGKPPYENLIENDWVDDN